MKSEHFVPWFDELAQLNRHQRELVRDALHPAAGLDRIVALIAQIRGTVRRCPRCDGTQCHRHSQANDLQRYRCCACERTFNDLTGTPLARLPGLARSVLTRRSALPNVSAACAFEQSALCLPVRQFRYKVRCVFF